LCLFLFNSPGDNGAPLNLTKGRGSRAVFLCFKRKSIPIFFPSPAKEKTGLGAASDESACFLDELNKPITACGVFRPNRGEEPPSGFKPLTPMDIKKDQDVNLDLNQAIGAANATANAWRLDPLLPCLILLAMRFAKFDELARREYAFLWVLHLKLSSCACVQAA